MKGRPSTEPVMFNITAIFDGREEKFISFRNYQRIQESKFF